MALAKVGARVFAGMELPTWNRTFLDRSIARSLRKADGTRPVVPHSVVLTHLPQLYGTDSHLFFGWFHGEERDLPRFLAAFPRMARFVSEFGAQAVPDWVGEDDDVDALGAQRRWFDRYVPRDDGQTFDEWRAATQRYQAALVKRHVEELRRLKYRPTGGFVQFQFADSAPRVSWSVLDHERRPKLGLGALALACAPVIVVADRLPATVRPGDAFALDVHVVSDLRRPLTDLTCTATLSWPGGAQRWRFAGSVPADACARIGTLQVEVPDDLPAGAELVLDLDVRGTDLPDGTVANRDATTVLAVGARDMPT
jgi:beta-mannosidase